MPITSVEIKKTIDEREIHKTTKEKERKTKRSKRKMILEAKWFCCTFKLGFLQLICKATLIFKSNYWDWIW